AICATPHGFLLLTAALAPMELRSLWLLWALFLLRDQALLLMAGSPPSFPNSKACRQFHLRRTCPTPISECLRIPPRLSTTLFNGRTISQKSSAGTALNLAANSITIKSTNETFSVKTELSLSTAPKRALTSLISSSGQPPVSSRPLHSYSIRGRNTSRFTRRTAGG